jgi:hypothetical protein
MYSPDYVARKRQLAVVLNNMAHFAEKIEAESRRLKEQGSTLKREGSQ